LASALREHQTGRLDEARRLYLEILSIDVRHCDSLHLLGMVEFGAGRPELAVRMIRRAITLRDDDASYHSNLGLVLQTQGKLSDAALEYEQALKLKPDYLEALYNLGSARKAQGRLAEAASCYERALNLQPDYVEAYNNLGNVYREQQKLEEARACFERALVLRPDYAESSNNLGILLRAQGNLEEARACLERALTLKPGYTEAWINLARTLQDLNRSNEAAACLRRLLLLRPDNFEACNSLGALLAAEGQLGEAHHWLSKALLLKPDFAEAANNLGNVLRDRGRPEEAAVYYERVLANDPGNAAAANNLGAVLVDQGRLADAIPCYERALALEPDNVAASNNLGVVLVEQGKLQEAERRFDFALALQPGHAEAQWNLALIELLKGDYANGWRNYEARFRRRRNPRRGLLQPQWRGEPLNGARILLRAEQGLGDSLQFLRYIPLVQAAGGKVILEIPLRLRRLAEQLAGIEEMVMSDDPPPQCDWQCPLMSLPLAFGTTVESIPAQVPYLSIPEAALWTAGALPWPARGLRVGVAWAGSPSHPSNRFRSLALAALAPLFRVRGVHFFSLQMGPATAELGTVRGQLTDLSPLTTDMADTAAQIAHLDLIITVDTSVAHLAGALAKPTWVLLPCAPDWRWMLGREDSPWYPTVRLFRQPRMYDWNAVVERLCVELEKLVG
jgi:tetratricopeptide (TPR) repeat protein